MSAASDAIEALIAFIEAEPLTTRLARLEHSLEGKEGADVLPLLATYGVTRDVLKSAILARTYVGRINDVIHATAISFALPQLLESGEILKRPSLAAGNDSTRLYDLETNRRVAEFKFAAWKGGDSARKKDVVKDLVLLAAEESDRMAELYVVGNAPIHFLRSTKSPVSWALSRYPPVKALYESRFGDVSVSISEFVNTYASRVALIDLEILLPDLLA